VGRKAAARRESAEAWWAFIARVLSFFAGIALLVHQEFFVATPTVALIVAGVGLCGPVVAQSVATVFAAIRGGGTNEPE
jgi:hypothetical protein